MSGLAINIREIFRIEIQPERLRLYTLKLLIILFDETAHLLGYYAGDFDNCHYSSPFMENHSKAEFKKGEIRSLLDYRIGGVT